MNRVCMVGRITSDPVVKNVNGNDCCNFQIAVQRSYTNADGKHDADFFNCAAWGGSATYLGKYVKKGFQLSVDGSLKNNPYKGKDGNIVRSEVIQCKEVNNLTTREEAQQGNSQQRQQYNSNNNTQQGAYQRKTNNYQQQGQQQQQRQSKPSYNNNQQQRPQNNQQRNNNQSFNVNVIDDDLPF